PEEAGVPSQSILAAVKRLEKDQIPMHSLLIMRHDKLIFERYYAPYTGDTLHRMFSITKTMTAIAIALLAEEGRIDLDESICTYFPEYVNEKTHPWIRATTIRNMLQMRTCHAASTYKVDMKSNWVESFFTVTPSHKPNTVFHYDTSAAHVMGGLVEKLTGMEMIDYLRIKVLDRIGFSKDAYVIKDPFGVSISGSGMVARPMDVLKVLYLLANNGRCTCDDGETCQLIPEWFTGEATSKISSTICNMSVLSEQQGYGEQIWRNEQGGFVLYGMGGQLAISLPQQDMLIMTTADTMSLAGGNQMIYNAIYDCILPALDTGTDPAAYDLLMRETQGLCIAPPKVSICPENAQAPVFKGKSFDYRYALQDNGSAFRELRLKVDESTGKGLLELSYKDGHLQKIPFGIGSMEQLELGVIADPYLLKPEDNTVAPGEYFAMMPCVAGACWTSSNALYIRVHIVGEYVGALHFDVYPEEKEITVFLRKVEETCFSEFTGHLYGTRV
ncbi:MAG: beta-lactamase family protein, partial [Lachnospiraceae bacterium]|nr:beta-lactamase family protein [Lachnospiraceae bacterium]